MDRQINYILGIDVGIASCGWAVLLTDRNGIPYRIWKLGSVTFPNGETYKGQSLASTRRIYRQSRRSNRRTKRRKHRATMLFIHNGLLTKRQAKDVFNQKPLPSIYNLRIKGLDHPLSNEELYRVLYYFVGHRHFKSSRKYVFNSKENSNFKKAIAHTQSMLYHSGYRTIGELLAKSPKYEYAKRNHGYDNGYHVSITHSMIDHEARLILHEQAKFNDKITSRFIKDYMQILDSYRDFDEGPGKPSPFGGNMIKKMIGYDTFDHSRLRASRATYTFEEYHMLNNLNNLRYRRLTGTWHKFNSEQRKKIISFSHSHQATTYGQIKKVLGLDKDIRFNLVYYGNGKSIKRAEKAQFCSFKDSHNIQKILPEHLRNDTKLLDSISEILSMYISNDARIKAFHKHLHLSDSTIDQLLNLKVASSPASLSLHTMKRLMPYLKKGWTLYDAADHLGYHTENRITAKYIYQNVKNPVVLHAFTITRKIVRAVINHYGRPDYINIELARALSKPAKEQVKIQRQQNKNHDTNQDAAKDIEKHQVAVNGMNITIDNLWHEQHGIDPYTGRKIPWDDMFNGTKYNIDHIVPKSWTQNDSYTNKILVSRKANEDKGDRLPMQYLAKQPAREKFLISFAKKTIKNPRKRTNLLRPGMTKAQIHDWRSRNLNDVRHISILVADYIKQNVKFSQNNRLDKSRVRLLNGGMTAKMRHRWGLTKVRIDGDKHHAMDAVVIACVTPALVKRINDLNKYDEIRHNPQLWKRNNLKEIKDKAEHSKIFNDFFNDFPLPWHDFRKEVIDRMSSHPSDRMSNHNWYHYSYPEIMKIKPIFVVHVNKRSIRGAVNKDTIRSNKYADKGLVMSRFNVSRLKIDRKGRIGSGAYKYHKTNGNQIVADHLRNALLSRNNNGKKAFPNGYLKFYDKGHHCHIVRHVKLFKKYSSGVTADHGHAYLDNGSIIRTDIFWNIQKKQYEYVPVYMKSVTSSHLPDIIAKSGKPGQLSENDQFICSLPNDTPVHITFKKPRHIKWTAKDHDQINYIKDFVGYFKNPNAKTGAINLIAADRSYTIFSTGMSTIAHLDKLDMDYLGNLHVIHQKKRLQLLKH